MKNQQRKTTHTATLNHSGPGNITISSKEISKCAKKVTEGYIWRDSSLFVKTVKQPKL